MDEIPLNWSISQPWLYVAAVLVCSLLVRVGHSLLGAIRQTHNVDGNLQTYGQLVRRNFLGFHPQPKAPDSPSSDYWYTFVVGVFELAIYPILIVGGAEAIIGAWIALKTLAQWKVWTEDRAVFNLFLIGNLANVAVAFFLLTPYVTATP